MRLSTKGRYAVTAMMELALNSEKGPVTLAEISHTQGISLSYLEQLFARMRRDGLVVGVRGPGGGYRLARPAGEISVAQIITAVDEGTAQGQSVGEGGADDDRCLTHDLWVDLSRQIYDFLNGITLEQMARDAGVREVAERVGSGDRDVGRGDRSSSVA
ncbi:MAG: Rrf2 family transcriptional regulator [Halorhodospira halophila]|uniref:Rrf2 family transcriptional regulator n=1 Tax=Halorhodospira TaxID=85108 RepID=UPI001911A715|nr:MULTISPECIES: Rrf2 family transcriptional regulator [Halorhodospira]MBK5937254.1 Rrf2 family transcriptional regulator [Halorhodospira halophila]MBK5942550.1 Rrf2 family transcriptional regulator [Halorhodospira halophila]MCC3751500.1 Rrf2 family transcriptional regulator [Halorhodospira halophila]MCG5528976.1 Rrf2 family transcriptional regulator [Halorhodospira halophila]MCG5533030.1 Rrf2 family transcriptional regulator [Halorhodospira sp. 9621]